jgi:hypothetical protein
MCEDAVKVMLSPALTSPLERQQVLLTPLVSTDGGLVHGGAGSCEIVPSDDGAFVS